MGGGKKKFTKPKPRQQRRSNRSDSLFIEGGILAGFNMSSSPSSSNYRGKKSGSSGKISGSRYGSSIIWTDGSNSNPNIKGGLSKSGANAIGYAYAYPSPDVQGVSKSDSNIGPKIAEDASSGAKPVILLGSRESNIVAYTDQMQPNKSIKQEYTYEYTAGFELGSPSHQGLGCSDEPESKIDEEEQLHRGLGFSTESDANTMRTALCSDDMDDEEEQFSASSSDDKKMFGHDDEGGRQEDDSEMVQEFLDKTSSRGRNDAYLSIGGMKLYTQDISDDESDEGDDEPLDEESSSESTGSDSEDSSYSGSDIDDELMEDYLDGIGGRDQLLDAKWLAKQNIDAPMDRKRDDDNSSDEGVDVAEKLSGIDLGDASRKYGMKKQASKSKYQKVPDTTGSSVVWSSALDDVMYVKDPRQLSKKKKHVTKFPQSWPAESRNSKRFRNFPGEKKKHRKEMIAVKRRERMLLRGVDLEKINAKLKNVVLSNADMFSFQPMHSRDCSQVQRLAAIYRLRSGCQGSGKKRFVTVSRTQHTSMPSASDEVRLKKLIGVNDDGADFAVTGTPKRIQSAKSKSSKKAYSDGPDRRSRSDARPSGKKDMTYASQPVSFVSSGVMGSEPTEATVSEAVIESEKLETKVEAISSSFGSFEVHTTGFGSKMMAKMGYVEGGGLGKDGKGMAEPIEVVQRPKSLGLGINFDDSSDGPSGRGNFTPSAGASSSRPSAKKNESSRGGASSSRSSLRKCQPRKNHPTPPPRIGAFEQHTMGFGSKMMAKMGFIEGDGLGRDSQGIVNPILAVRRPRARGLGAET